MTLVNPKIASIEPLTFARLPRNQQLLYVQLDAPGNMLVAGLWRSLEKALVGSRARSTLCPLTVYILRV